MPDPAITTALASIPKGRMLAVRTIETALREGATFAVAARRARVSLSTAKHWASAMRVRKQDLAAESAEDRIARHASWAVALAAMGRVDEAGAFERAARQLETVVDRLDRRTAASPEAISVYAAPRAFLARVCAVTGEGDVMAAWNRVAAWYRGLQALGAEIAPDGRASWPDGLPETGLPDPPAWLPSAPWAVTDEAVWEREAGEAMRML